MPAAIWLLAFLVAYYVAAPLLSLTHELGHALVRLADTTARVRVEIGTQPLLTRVRIGRLTLLLRPWPGWGVYAGMPSDGLRAIRIAREQPSRGARPGRTG